MVGSSLLIATTSTAAWLLDTETGAARQIDSGRGVYYGISFNENELFIACREAPVGGDRAPQVNSVLCFDRNLRLRRVLKSPRPIRDVHQVFCHRGRLFITGTFDDLIHIYDLEADTWRLWFPFGEGPECEDRHHINSIFVDDEGVLLAGLSPDGWMGQFRPDRLRLVDGYQKIGSGTHNVWREADRSIWVGSANECALRSNRGGFRRFHPRGWLRGVAKLPGRTFLGLSQVLVRDVRQGSDCSIIQIDSADRITRCFSFNGCGMLHDIRTVNAPDPTHNNVCFELSPALFDDGGPVYATKPDLVAL